MSKCNRAKRPCKICLATVTQRNGLQCQGACQSWVHYSCLNYTPGKIKDIKNGIIRVTCPCPDCKTILPKEYRTDQPFSCSNQMCPANRPPKCDNDRCPINKGERLAAPPKTCPLGKCGTGCKPNSNPQIPYADYGPQRPGNPCVPLPPQLSTIMSPAMSDGCLDPNRCPSGCSSTTSMPRSDVTGDCGTTPVSAAPSLRAIEDMCTTIGILTSQLNELMSKIQNLNPNPEPKADRCGAACPGKTGKVGPKAVNTKPPAKTKPPANCTCRVKTKKKLI